ncbi:MAG: hypothetical protein C0605_15410 [Hyphomicrobiales bacterium]|nr:MAG: hypothetical protein C0605_15410 [Hyphomicrobiales bacterium]
MKAEPQSDCLEGCRHPRENDSLLGQAAAEAHLLEAYRSGKMHHAWILSGPRGIGKATLAYRTARFIFQNPDPQEIAADMTSLHVDASSPLFHRVAARGHSDLLVIRRGYDQKRKKLRSEIRADEVRQTTRFFSRTSGEGGWRICIVDTANDMNPTAANALLKNLEEPPERALFLLISHAPHRLLPTIRSRCCSLPMPRLAEADIRHILTRELEGEAGDGTDLDLAVRLSGGRAGRAIELLKNEGADVYRDIFGLMRQMPDINPELMLKLAGKLTPVARQAQFDLFFDLLLNWLWRMVRGGLTGFPDEIAPGEADIMRRLTASGELASWSALWEKVNQSFAEARVLNLDRKQLVLDTLFSIENTARETG